MADTKEETKPGTQEAEDEEPVAPPSEPQRGEPDPDPSTGYGRAWGVGPPW